MGGLGGRAAGTRGSSKGSWGKIVGKGLWGRVKGQDGKDQGLQTTDPPGFTKPAQKSNEASISTTTDPPQTLGIGLVAQKGLEAKEQAGPLERSIWAPPEDRHVSACKGHTHPRGISNHWVRGQRHPRSPMAQQESGRCLGSASDPKCWGKDTNGATSKHSGTREGATAARGLPEAGPTLRVDEQYG